MAWIFSKLLIDSVHQGTIPFVTSLPTSFEDIIITFMESLLWLCTSSFLLFWFPLVFPFRSLVTFICFLLQQPSQFKGFSPSPPKWVGSTRNIQKNGPNHYLINDILSVIFDTYLLFAIPWNLVWRFHREQPTSDWSMEVFIFCYFFCWQIGYLSQGYFWILLFKYLRHS